MNDDICTVCGKVRFLSWRAAARNARGIMRQRKASKGMVVYRDKACRCIRRRRWSVAIPTWMQQKERYA